jgi:FkbM family methyltransferase
MEEGRQKVIRMLQSLIISTVRPYVVRELPGWGKFYVAFLSYKRDWLWRGAAVRAMRGKIHGYTMHLELTHWPDRLTYFLGRWYDLDTQLFLADVIKAGDTVIDVGANRGNFALACVRLVGEAGKVICFEPNPSVAQKFEREISANSIKNISLHQAGLGAEATVLTLSVPLVNSGEATFGVIDYEAKDVYEVNVPVLVGDQALAGERPNLIKIDVEGFECKVITGLTETLRRDKPIVITEVVPHHLERCGASYKQLLALMTDLGYEPFRLVTRKDQGKYKWALGDIPTQDDACFDAVWLTQGVSERYPVLGVQ